jgi:disulfide bond formation protein DsbB
MALTRRTANLLGFAACAVMMAYALYEQHVVGLEPCHLCILQRVGIMAIGAVFLVAGLHAPKGGGAKVYGVLVALAALATAITAGRHVWIQQQPPGAVAACGADLDFMMQIMPLHQVIAKVFAGGGECQKIDWQFLGLTMPGWVLVVAIALGAWGLWANFRRAPATR